MRKTLQEQAQEAAEREKLAREQEHERKTAFLNNLSITLANDGLSLTQDGGDLQIKCVRPDNIPLICPMELRMKMTRDGYREPFLALFQSSRWDYDRLVSRCALYRLIPYKTWLKSREVKPSELVSHLRKVWKDSL